MSDSSLPALDHWDEYRGQERLKGRLMVHATAASAQVRMLDDILFAAPPGTGKTTLARLLAQLVNDPFYTFLMPVEPRRFLQFCRRWEGGVLLLDELHSAPLRFQELLYTAIGQDNKVLIPPSGPRIDVNHITFIGATTEPDQLATPLWDRFKIKPRWDDYTDDEMADIVSDSLDRIDIALPRDTIEALARATGGTPRMVNTLVGACRDLKATDREVTAEAVLELVGVDVDGLTERHIDYLRTLDTLNGCSGLRNLCTMMRLPTTTVEDLERLLIQRGMISLEPNGRTLTEAGDRKLPEAQSPVSVRQRRAS